jgi:hypothetical protein
MLKDAVWKFLDELNYLNGIFYFDGWDVRQLAGQYLMLFGIIERDQPRFNS